MSNFPTCLQDLYATIVMLDLDSDDPRSASDHRPQSELIAQPQPLPEVGEPPLSGLVVEPPLSGLVVPHRSRLDDASQDDLQTVERVLPTTAQNYAANQMAGLKPATPHYIQAIKSKTGALLKTNLPRTETTRTSETGIAWLMGRSRNCAIVFPDAAVSRCHAVIGYDAQQGFYVMDVGSSNGTFLNQQRLVTLQRYGLTNGDIVTISHINVELFLLDQD
jgi:pSer/pThr/pTyr-binding forkhead associated (FHA) protein